MLFSSLGVISGQKKRVVALSQWSEYLATLGDHGIAPMYAYKAYYDYNGETYMVYASTPFAVTANSFLPNGASLYRKNRYFNGDWSGSQGVGEVIYANIIACNFDLLTTGGVVIKAKTHEHVFYQTWDGYADSPVTLDQYPYQTISTRYDVISLSYTDDRLYCTTPISPGLQNLGGSLYRRVWDGSTWGSQQNVGNMTFDTIFENNFDIYTGSAMTTLYKAKSVDSGLFQKWNGYRDSPLLTSAYPYQILGTYGGDIWLIMSPTEIINKENSMDFRNLTYQNTMKIYKLITGVWSLWATTSSQNLESASQCNFNIYNSGSWNGSSYPKTTLYKTKTTP